MPDQQRAAAAEGQHVHHIPPQPPNQTAPSKSLLASMIRWLQIKKYQYEVTFSLYMLTSTEKFVFNAIILILFSLLVAAAVCYLPNHIAIVSNRLWYYVHGEFLYATQGVVKDQQQAQGMWKAATSALTAAASQSAEALGGAGGRREL